MIECWVNVILTFDNQPQEFYDTPIAVEYEELGTEFEVEVIRQILEDSERDLSDLVKISLAYDSQGPVSEALAYLIRHNAKYYFQPNQRDDYEQAIVDALGIANKTKELMV